MKNHLGFEENCRRRIKRGHKNFKGKNQLNDCVFCVCVELESPARRPPPLLGRRNGGAGLKEEAAAPSGDRVTESER